MAQVTLTKDQWIALFQAIGLSTETMKRWHQEFEARHPDQHQTFLEWLGIPEEEIRRIRAG
jgi:hypothetical protein